MDEPRLFKDIIGEAIENSGFSIEKLAGATGVPERFLIALIEGNYHVLPAAPYTKGYIRKIAESLNTDADGLWVAFERESRPMRSGSNDALPGNRFFMSNNLNKKKLALYASAILLVIYTGFNAKRLIGVPDLYILSPENSVTKNFDGLAMIRGRIENPKDIVNINGSPIYVDEFGEFQKEFQLDPGVNNFDITVKRFLGRIKLETRQIIFEQPIVEEKENKNNKN